MLSRKRLSQNNFLCKKRKIVFLWPTSVLNLTIWTPLSYKDQWTSEIPAYRYLGYLFSVCAGVCVCAFVYFFAAEIHRFAVTVCLLSYCFIASFHAQKLTLHSMLRKKHWKLFWLYFLFCGMPRHQYKCKLFNILQHVGCVNPAQGNRDRKRFFTITHFIFTRVAAALLYS